MIEYKALLLVLFTWVSDCVNTGVGHKIDPVVDGGLWVQLKTKASTKTTEKPYLPIVGWKDLEISKSLVPATFIRDTSIII